MIEPTTETVREAAAWSDGALLDAIARGRPLELVLQRICRSVDELVEGGRCLVVVVDDEGFLRVRASASAPFAVVQALDGMVSPIGAGDPTGAVVVDELIDRAQWAAVADELAAHGLGAMWRWSLHARAEGLGLGAVVILTAPGRRPTPDDERNGIRARDFASIALERSFTEAALLRRTLYDELTGLPNRMLIDDRLEQALVRARRRGTVAAVLFVGLDRFTNVNDSLGHGVGDDMLRMAATRFRALLRSSDTVGRFGGDEFVFVCEEVDDAAGALIVANRILAAMEHPFTIDNEALVLGASVGVALATSPDVDAHVLLRDASAALDRAKDQGRNRAVVFEIGFHERAVTRLDVERALRKAIDGGELVVHYQPVVRVDDTSLVSLEALVRWARPGHGLVEPNAFIPIAEESGLIVPLGRWVLGEACRAAAAWPATPQGVVPTVSVNLSARQIADPLLVDLVEEALDMAGLPPERLCLEVTESVIVHELDHSRAALERLTASGVRLAIDDFGTGYATLDYVRRFSMADTLKIDRSFIEGVEERGSQEAAIVAASISLAKALGFSVVAEGVQTPQQLSVLAEFGCEAAQGFLFSEPLAPGGVAVQIARRAQW